MGPCYSDRTFINSVKLCRQFLCEMIEAKIWSRIEYLAKCDAWEVLKHATIISDVAIARIAIRKLGGHIEKPNDWNENISLLPVEWQAELYHPTLIPTVRVDRYGSTKQLFLAFVMD